MAGSSSGNSDEISGINVTPLVDIMLVLVIILMVTAEFTRYKTVAVSLPKVNASVSKKIPQKVNLTIKEKGELFWNDKKTELKLLEAKLKHYKKIKPRLAVILRAEGKTDYNQILTVLDEVKKAGVSRVGLAVDSNKKK